LPTPQHAAKRVLLESLNENQQAQTIKSGTLFRHLFKHYLCNYNSFVSLPLYKVVALSDLAPGSPLLLDYGQLRNDFLLLDYGFIVENNPHDRVELRFDRNLLEAARVVGGVDREQFGGGDQKRGNVAPWQQAVLTQLQLAGPQAKLQVRRGQLVEFVFPRW
jgi:hypothetical protein